MKVFTKIVLFLLFIFLTLFKPSEVYALSCVWIEQVNVIAIVKDKKAVDGFYLSYKNTGGCSSRVEVNDLNQTRKGDLDKYLGSIAILDNGIYEFVLNTCPPQYSCDPLDSSNKMLTDDTSQTKFNDYKAEWENKQLKEYFDVVINHLFYLALFVLLTLWPYLIFLIKRHRKVKALDKNLTLAIITQIAFLVFVYMTTFYYNQIQTLTTQFTKIIIVLEVIYLTLKKTFSLFRKR